MGTSKSKPDNWFSRRHENREPHMEAVASFQANSGRWSRQQTVEENKSKRASSPEEQLKRLDKRLGKGVGAKRERARLAALIKS